METSSANRTTMEPWSWRNRLTPQSDPDSPFEFSTPILSSTALITPPSSGSSNVRVLGTDCGTPRSHRMSIGLTNLPRELTCKCVVAEKSTPSLPSIKEEGEIPEVRKRRLQTSLFSPQKKACFRPKFGTPKKLSEVLCIHQKENSPIKVDFGAGAGFPFVLKPPPRKLDAPCPAHNSKEVDFVAALASRNMYKVLEQVLSNLSPLDVFHTSLVSKTWRHAINNTSTASSLSKRHQLALTSKENYFPLPKRERVPDGETTPLKHFVVQNKNPSPKRRLLVLPELSPPSKRFAYYVREAKALGKKGTLTKCPKCRCPAPVFPDCSRTVCTECRYSFCPQCRCASHVGNTCSFTISSSPETPPKEKQVIGSKSSKKALRRLL